MNLEELVAAMQDPKKQKAFGDAHRNAVLDYWNKIQQYKGTQYYDQLLNNPYFTSQYADSPVVGLLSGDGQFSQMLNFLTLGLSGSIGNQLHNDLQSNFYQQQTEAGNEEFSRILGAMEQDKYNSPAAQANRERAAGLNPSLLGVDGQPASSGAGPDETASPLGASGINEVAGQVASSALQQVGGMCSSFLSGIMNMAQYFQEFEGRSIANATNDLGFADTLYNYAVKTAAGLSSLPSTRSAYDALSEEEKLGTDETVYKTLQEVIKYGDLGSFQLNRRARRMLKKMTGRVIYDKEGKPTLAFQAQRAAMLKGFYGDTLEAGKAGGHPVMSDPENFATVLEKSVRFFGDLETKTQEYTLKLQDIMLKQQGAEADSAVAQSQYNTKLYTGELGEAENAARTVEAQMKAVQEELNNYLDAQLKELLDSFDDDGLWGKLGRIGILSLRSALKSFSASLIPMMTKNGSMMTGLGMNFNK